MSACRCADDARRPDGAPDTGAVAELDDDTLAVRAREDRDAFAELYRRYQVPIYRFVLSRLRRREEAEDVTSEVFVKALRSIDRYQPTRAPFWAWLYRIASNAVVDQVRRRRESLALDELPERADPTGDVERVVLGRAGSEQIWTVVSRLSRDQRAAVTLRLAEEMPIAGIAGRLSRSEGAVKQLVLRGMITVRRHLLAAELA